MPPRYAYWTIIVDDQPTAFRSGSQEELMPTFKRLKAKNDTAKMMWFQIGKLWPSRVDAQEFMHSRSETARKGDDRQPGSGFRDRNKTSKSQDFRTPKPQHLKTSKPRDAWTPRGEPSTPAPARNADDKLDWKPKGEFVPAPRRADRAEWKPRDEKPAWKPKSSENPDWKSKTSGSGKPAWKPKGSFTPEPRRSEGSDWKAKSSFDRDRKPSSRPSDREERPRSFKRPDFKSSGDDTRSAKPEWKPQGSFTPAPRRPGGSEWKSKPDWKGKSEAERRGPGRSAEREGRPEWKSKGSFTPAPRRSEGDWKSKSSSSDKPASNPKGSFDRERKPAWKPNRDTGGRFSSSEGARAPRGEKLEWKPKGEGYKSKAPEGFTPSGEKRKWMPKEEYKKSMGIEAKRDGKWRPGGEHKDPKQKYKDAKKAKWSKFKQNIRTRSGGKGKKTS